MLFHHRDCTFDKFLEVFVFNFLFSAFEERDIFLMSFHHYFYVRLIESRPDRADILAIIA
jgi:hypothetical protein